MPRNYRKKRAAPRPFSKKYRSRPRTIRRRKYRPVKKSLSVVKVRNNGQVQPFSGYTSKYPYWKNKLEKLYFSAAKNIYQSLTSENITVSAGKQICRFYTSFSVADIISALNVVTKQPGTAGQVKNTTRSYLQKCISEYNMTNSSNAPIEFSVYLYKCKRDAEDSLLTAWTQGIEDQQGNAATSNSPSTYGMSPLNDTVVNSYWKCHKIIHYNVMAGQTFKFVHTSNLFKLLNNEIIQADMQVDAYLKGYTSGILFIVKGAAAKETTTNTVTSALGSVALICNKMYHWKYIEDSNTNINTISELVAGTAPQVLNPSGYVADLTAGSDQYIPSAGI